MTLIYNEIIDFSYRQLNNHVLCECVLNIIAEKILDPKSNVLCEGNPPPKPLRYKHLDT